MAGSRKKVTLLLTNDRDEQACADYLRSSLCSAEILRRWLVFGYLNWDKLTVRDIGLVVKEKMKIDYSHYGKDGHDVIVSKIFNYLDSIRSNTQRLLTIRHIVLLGYELENGLLTITTPPVLVEEIKEENRVAECDESLPSSLMKAKNSMKGLIDV